MPRIAHKLDKTDDITMRYMHELNQVRKSRNVRLVDDKDTGKKKKRRQTVTYNIGNETIIQPVASGLKDNVGLHTMINIAIGVAVGVAVMAFLVMPRIFTFLVICKAGKVLRSDQISGRITHCFDIQFFWIMITISS